MSDSSPPALALLVYCSCLSTHLAAPFPQHTSSLSPINTLYTSQLPLPLSYSVNLDCFVNLSCLFVTVVQ